MNLLALGLITSLLTWIYFWEFERDSYRASWRIHTFGIGLPIVLMMTSRHPAVWTIASSFATVHVASILSEK